MLPSFASDTPTLIKPTWTTDARNQRRPDYGDAAERVPVPGSLLQPGASVEVMDVRAAGAVAVRWSWFAPAGTVVDPTDAVEWEGTRYAVDGQSARHRSPTGALDHVLVLLIDWK